MPPPHAPLLPHPDREGGIAKMKFELNLTYHIYWNKRPKRSLNFLTKTGEQHKGRLLVVVSFFVYFRRVSSRSLTETSSGNEYN